MPKRSSNQLTTGNAVRFMRHLNSAGFVKETGKGEYTANGISAALATRVPAGMTKQWCVSFLYSFAHIANMPQLHCLGLCKPYHG
jgi:hypothetical protein